MLCCPLENWIPHIIWIPLCLASFTTSQNLLYQVKHSHAEYGRAYQEEALVLMESDLQDQSLRGADISLIARSACKRVQVEDSDVSSIDDQDELLPRPVRKKRPNCRYTEWSSDDEYCLRALKRSFPKYREPDSSSDSESYFTRAVQDNVPRSSKLPIGVVRSSSSQVVLAKWRSDGGCKPCVDEAPVFYPTEEEFTDTLKYIANIRPIAEPFGICRVVPPPGWEPPCPLREDAAKVNAVKFPTRVQEIHKLQVRQPATKCSPARQWQGGKRCQGGFRGRMGRPCRRTPNMSTNGKLATSVQPDESFGFELGSYFSLGAFEKYAQQFMEQYFCTAVSIDDVKGNPETKAGPESRMCWSIDDIEAEYWRIVERPTEQVEVLYGADVETGSFGSGFPKSKAGDALTEPNCYENSGWNLNNIARLPGSMLSFEEGDISGVLVPWLYVGMCFSSFCWHVEDHHFYSLNYLHWGAPKVWYGVPGNAACAMETVMKKHLPALFHEQPDLLHKLVTQLSPSILKGESLPVYRLLQQPGEFVITFPRAYHSGFNCGFNCAEAVNVAPVDWLPHGQSAVELYREQHRKTSVSHDKLLLAASKEAAKILFQTHKHDGKSQCQDLLKEQHQEERFAYKARQTRQDSCGEVDVLVTALKTRVGLERTRHAALTGVVEMRKMDHCYDSTDERECAECYYDLYLSAVGCDCSPEKYVCLAHSPLLCLCQWGRKYVLYRYNVTQLEMLVAALEERPGALGMWFEHAQRSSAVSCALSPIPQKVGQVSRLSSDLAPLETKSSEFLLDKAELEVQDIASVGVMQTDSSYSKPSILGGTSGMLDKPSQEMSSQSIFPLQHDSQTFVTRFDSVQQAYCLPCPTGAGQDEKLHMRGQVGMSLDWKLLQNGSMKSKEHFLEPSVVPVRKEVIFLSDDEDGLLSPVARVMSIGKFNEGISLGSSHFTRYMTVSQKFERVSAGVGSLERQEFIPDVLNGAHAEELHRFSHEVPQLGLSIPVHTSAQMPSKIVTPPVNLQGQMDKSLPVVSTLLSIHRSILSIKNLKKAARAIGTRSDYLRQIAGEEDVCGVDLCGIEFTMDSHPLLHMPSGNVQFRTSTDREAERRVARVLGKKIYCEVELLHVGSLVNRDGWCNEESIFPAGFRSRTKFCNVLNVCQDCFYVSEIVECGQTGPKFKVSVEGNNTTAFWNDSVDVCWQIVQAKVNEEIIRQQGFGEASLPLLHPPESLHGLDMFGFTSMTIIQAIEALDPQHQSAKYWSGKFGNLLAGRHDLSTLECETLLSASDAPILGQNESGTHVEVTSRPATPATH